MRQNGQGKSSGGIGCLHFQTAGCPSVQNLVENLLWNLAFPGQGGSRTALATMCLLLLQLTVKDGVPVARIQWSSPNYDYMVVDGRHYDNLSEEGMNSVFEIPVLCWDGWMDAIADTTAMGSPVEVHYQLFFYRESVGSKNELPQEAAKRVLCVAVAIIVIGGVLNYILKKKNS